jgi:hypothetical protein
MASFVAVIAPSARTGSLICQKHSLARLLETLVSRKSGDFCTGKAYLESLHSPWVFVGSARPISSEGGAESASKRGCLQGLEGILAARDADRKVIISVDPIEKSLAIHIKGYDIEPI